jgi:integrase
VTAYGPRGGRLYRRKTWDGGTIWVADYMGADGRRRRKSLSPDKRIAEKQLDVILQERDLAIYGANSSASQDALLDEVKAAYLADLAARARPNSVRSATDALTRILGRLDAVRVRDVSIPKVLEYRSARRGEGLSARTVNVETGTLRACLQWALGAGIIVINPLANLKRLPLDESNQVKKRRALTEPEIIAFLNAATHDDEERKRWYAAETTIAHGTKGRAWEARERKVPVPQRTLWLTFIATGLRWSEVAALRWLDLDTEERWFTVSATVAKGRRSRRVPVTNDLMASLRELRAANARTTGRMPGPENHIFLSPLGSPWASLNSSNARKLLYDVFERAGIARTDEQGRSLDLHALRGTAATRLLRNHVELAHVAKILGHQDVRLTMKHYEDLQIEDLRTEMDRVPAIGAATKPGKAKRAAPSQRAS